MITAMVGLYTAVIGKRRAVEKMLEINQKRSRLIDSADPKMGAANIAQARLLDAQLANSAQLEMKKYQIFSEQEAFALQTLAREKKQAEYRNLLMYYA